MSDEKIFLVTGASGGIGYSVIKSLVDSGKTVISSSRSTPKFDFNKAENEKRYSHYNFDLTEEKNIDMLYKLIKDKFGKVDAIINTIGGSLFSHKIEDYPLNEFEQVLKLNLTSAFMLTKCAIKLMKNTGGNIVHIVSSSAKKISTNKAPYGMAKSALANLIQYAAVETAKYNIVVNGISPTYVFTPRHETDIRNKMEKTGQSHEDVEKKIFASQVIKKPQYSIDLIPVIELLSNTRVITGQIYNVTMGEILNY